MGKLALVALALALLPSVASQGCSYWGHDECPYEYYCRYDYYCHSCYDYGTSHDYGTYCDAFDGDCSRCPPVDVMYETPIPDDMRVTSSWENFELSQPTVDVIEDATESFGDRLESNSISEECERDLADEMDDHGLDTMKHYPIVGAAINIAEHYDEIPAEDPFAHLAAVEAMKNIMYSGVVLQYTKDELSQHVLLHLKDEGAYRDSCPDDWNYLGCLEISFTLDAVLKEDAIAANLPEEDEEFRTKLTYKGPICAPPKCEDATDNMVSSGNDANDWFEDIKDALNNDRGFSEKFTIEDATLSGGICNMTTYIVVGGLIVLAMIGCCCFCCYKKNVCCCKKKAEGASNPQAMQIDMNPAMPAVLAIPAQAQVPTTGVRQQAPQQLMPVATASAATPIALRSQWQAQVPTTGALLQQAPEQLMPMARPPQPVAAAPTARQLMASDLAPLDVGTLRKRAAEVGVDPDLIEDARDGDQPKQELIALIMAQHGARP